MNPSIYKAKLFDLPAWCTLNPAFPPKMPDKGSYVPSAPVVPTLQPGKHIFVPKKNKASVAKPDLFHLLRQKTRTGTKYSRTSNVKSNGEKNKRLGAEEIILPVLLPARPSKHRLP